MASILAQKLYSRIPDIFSLPTLIDVQTESFEWLRGEGLRDLFDEISPIESYNGGMKLFFPGNTREVQGIRPQVLVRRPQARYRRVRGARSDVRRTAVRLRAPGRQRSARADQAGHLPGRLPADDRQGHLHHQRHRARRRLAADPLAGRVLRGPRGSRHRPPSGLRQTDPGSRRLDGVRDTQERLHHAQVQPQAHGAGHHVPARPGGRGRRAADGAARRRLGRRDHLAVLRRRQQPRSPLHRHHHPPGTDVGDQGRPHAGGRGADRVLPPHAPRRSSDARQRPRVPARPAVRPAALRPGARRPLQAQHQAPARPDGRPPQPPPRDQVGHRTPGGADDPDQQRHHEPGRHRPPGQPPGEDVSAS